VVKKNSSKMDNSQKIILDLAGGTGSWSKPYLDAGYDVRLVTLPDNDVRTYVPPDNVYEILAAPPCTMFSFARTTAKTPRDFDGAMDLIYGCLRIIWECRKNGTLKFWAMENPMGYLRQFIGKPVLTFQPCEYGDPYIKKTDLWGYYNIPKKDPIKMTPEQIQACSINNRKLPELPDWYIAPDGNTIAARRAMTPPGFAKAFFLANQ